MTDNIAIVMPAYNEEESIGKVIRGLKRKRFSNIFVVDDGSKDRTSQVAMEEGATVVRHIINRGLGGALGTGIEAALREGADVIVTFDSDGQHSPDDIPNVIKPIIADECDVVIGIRLIEKKKMPYYKKIGNFGLNLITYLLFGAYSSDTQSGFRAFSKEAARSIQIKSNGYEVSSEIIKEIGRLNLRVKEVPIKTIYTKYSIKKGTNFIAGIRILIKLSIDRFFR